MEKCKICNGVGSYKIPVSSPIMAPYGKDDTTTVPCECKIRGNNKRIMNEAIDNQKLSIKPMFKSMKKDIGDELINLEGGYVGQICVDCNDCGKDWTEELVGALARGYCADKNEQKELDADLLEAQAIEVDKLIQTLLVEEFKKGYNQAIKDFKIENEFGQKSL